MRWLKLPRARRFARPRRRRERVRSRAASRRSRANPLLPAHVFGPGRPSVPVFADLLGLCGRGDRAPWPLGGLLDGRGARVPLPSLGRVWLRPAARSAAHGRLMGATLALWTLALRRVSLAYDARGLYGLAPFLIQPQRSDRWPSRVGPPKLRVAWKAVASSSSRRAITTRLAPTCLRARPARSRPQARPTTSSEWPGRWKYQPAWRSLSMLRKRQAALMTERSRSAVSCGARPFISRSSPASRRERSWTCRSSAGSRSAMAFSPR